MQAKDKSNSKLTQTNISNPSPHGSTFQNWTTAGQEIAGTSKKLINTRRRNKKMFSWCGKFCKRHKSESSDRGKSKINPFDCWRKKSKRNNDGKSVLSEKSSGISSVHRQESFEESLKEKTKGKRAKREKPRKSSKDLPSRKSKRTKVKIQKQKDEKGDSETSVFSTAAPSALHDEKLMTDHIGNKELRDFTKSCCYLCAKNTLAITAAIPRKLEKYDMSIQVSHHQFFKDTQTSVKNCSPGHHVRTVQSSIKVKTRETSTHCTETPKEKKTKTKPKHKKFSMFPKLKYTKCPAMRNAACETERPNKADNKVKCDQKQEHYCRTKNK